MRKFGFFAALFTAAFLLLFLDFYTKAYVYTLLPGNLDVFQNVLGVDFSITLAFNKGAAWGIFSDFQLAVLVFRILVIGALIAYLFVGQIERYKKIPLTLIATGALGNVVDFFLYGSVVDFLRFNLWGYPFPVFNCADTFITVGVFSFFFASLLNKKKEVKKIDVA